MNEQDGLGWLITRSVSKSMYFKRGGKIALFFQKGSMMRRLLVRFALAEMSVNKDDGGNYSSV